MKKILSVVLAFIAVMSTAYAAEVEIRSDKGVGKVLSEKIDDNTVKIDVTTKLTDGKKPLAYEYVTIAMYGPEKKELSYAERVINNKVYYAYYINQARTDKDGNVKSSFTVSVKDDETCYIYFSGKNVNEAFELEVLLPPPDEQVIKPMPTPGSSGGGGGGGGGGGKKGSGISSAVLPQSSSIAQSSQAQQSGDAEGVNNLSFSDITQSHWAYNDCMKLCKLGIVSGYDDNSIRPAANVSREEIAVVLTKAFKINVVDEDFEMDNTSSQWAKKYIAAAVKGGIMSVNPNGTYRGTENATRAEVVTMINRCLKLESTGDAVGAFDDADEIPDYSKAGFSVLIEKGIVNGYEDNTLRPNGNITRAELFKIVSKILEEVSL